MLALKTLHVKGNRMSFYIKFKNLATTSLSKNIFNLILMPIITSVIVTLIMQDYFTKQQIKKEIVLKVTSLEDEIVKYNEVFVNNFPLRFANNINKNLIVDDLRLTDAKDRLKEISKDHGNETDKALAEYLLQYTRKNLTDSNRAYIQMSLEIGSYEEKYKYMQSNLKIIKERIKILNNELGCNNSNNILSELSQALYKREEFHNTTMSHILKTLESFQMKYGKGYVNSDQYEHLMQEFVPPYIFEKEDFRQNSDLTNNLITKFIEINGNFITDYNNGKIDAEDYCKRLSKD